MVRETILNTINKYNLINPDDTIVVAVSGGPDSIAMLNILNEIRKEKIMQFDLIVAHINHMIREEAVEDEKYVQEYCEKNQIQYYCNRHCYN